MLPLNVNYFYLFRDKVSIPEKSLWVIIEIRKLLWNTMLFNYFDLNFLLLNFLLVSFHKASTYWVFSFTYFFAFFRKQSHFSQSMKEIFSLSQVVWSRSTYYLCPFKQEKGKILQSIFFLIACIFLYFSLQDKNTIS